MNPLDTARLLIAVAIVKWMGTAVIAMKAHERHEYALTERARVSAVFSVLMTLFAVAAINRIVPFLPQEIIVPLLLGGIVVATAVDVLWIVDLRRGRFR